ncbi:porin [Oryzomonas japonica]|uniref:Porin n=1 Tax=Oryzomonas japonica TaxID=2603858 RepID=A0A7J4ZVP5_9BACT|nr:porin [Oryzomonas japonica]KAB0667529.1 porin [Oryzomonas japonica]
MKRLGVLLGVALIAAQAGPVSAKSLEDVLKEKGVITEDDYKNIQKSSPIKYKLGDGFTFTSADGKFSTSIGGVYQLRYTLMDLDDVNNTAAKRAQDYSKFELKRIKLHFNGYAYSPDLTYKMQLNFANIAGGTTNNGGLLEFAWLNYRLRDEIQFRFGQDKVQFGRQWITSSDAQQFVDTSAVTSAFVPGYDTGVMIHGKIAGGLVNYNIGGYGGVGQNTYRTTTDNSFAARLAVNPLGDVKYSESDVEYSVNPLVSFGANFFRDTIYNGETNNLFFAKSTSWYGLGSTLMTKKFSAGEPLDFNTAGADAVFKWRGFSATGEYFFAEADGQTSKNRLRADGFYAQAGYFVIPKTVELAYRYSYIDPNRDVTNDHWVENTGAVSWYINKQNLKIQADYTNIHKQAAIASTSGKNATDDQQVRFQVQMQF